MTRRGITRICSSVALAISILPSTILAQEIHVVAKRLSEINTTTFAQAPAQVTSDNRSILAAEVDAIILEVMYDVSETVKKGATLVKLDRRDFQLKLAQAQANLNAQEARIRRGEVRLKRAQELVVNNFVSEDELLERQTDLEVLKADHQVEKVSVSSAVRELSKTKVIAPFDGVVVERNAQVGAFATRGTALVTLSEIASPNLMAQVTNGDIESVQGSRSLVFKSDIGEWPIEIESISPVLDNRSRVQTVKLSFRDSQPLVGTSGYLIWERPEQVVTTDVIVTRNGQLGIFLLEDENAKFHILAKAQEGRPAIVPLPIDTLVIVEGQQRINDGDRVANTR